MLRQDAPAPSATRVKIYNTFDLQRTLVRYSRQRDDLTGERICQHVLCVGATGSSKTRAFLDTTIRAVMEAGYGILLLSAKSSAYEEGYDMAIQSGCQRVIRFGPDTNECFNWADYEYHDFGDGKGHVDNLMSVLKSLIEVTMRSSGQKESEPFWQFLNDQGFANLFFVDGRANGSIDLSRMLDMWQSIPTNFDQLNEPEKLASLAALIEAQKNCGPEHLRSLKLAENWLTKQMPALSERTRSCVEAMAIGMLDSHCRDIMQKAMGGESTWIPDAICDGAVVVCGYDVMRYGAVGKLIQVGCKRSLQRTIGRRLVKFQGRVNEMRPVVIIADEAQFFMDSSDLEYLRTSREARGGCLWSIQSIPSVIHELGGGAAAENQAKATLGMFQTKVYHYNDCDVTNEQAARWIGQDMQWRPGASVGVNERGEVSRGQNWSEQPYYLVPPIAFSRLPRGGEAEKWEVRTIVTMAGHRWKCNGKRYWAKIKFFHSREPHKDAWWLWPYPRDPASIFFDRVATARRWSLSIPLKRCWELWRLIPDRRMKLCLRWLAFWIDERITLRRERDEL